MTQTSLDVQVGGSHYKGFVVQPVEFITRNKLGFLEGCIIKRVCRYKDKNGKEDLEKAIHELQMLIEFEYGESGRQREETAADAESHCSGLEQDLVQAAREAPQLF